MRQLLNTSCLIASIIALLCLPASAQQWRNFGGPNTGTIGQYVIAPGDPALMFAVESQSHVLYRSTDGGDSWAAVTNPFQQKSIEISAVACDPVSPATIYIRTSSEPYMSTDRGITWTKGEYFSLLTTIFRTHPTRGGTIYAGGYGSLRRTTTGGMTARSWDTVLVGTGLNITSISFNPLHPDTMFAGTSKGPYRSLDAGATWSVWPSEFAQRAIGDVHADAADPRRYYLLSNDTVYISTDGGNVWNKGATRIWGGRIEQCAGDPQRMFVWGSYWVYRSLDRGATWTMIDSIHAYPKSFVLHPTNPMVIYSSPLNDIPLKSTDGGTTWIPNARGMAGVVVQDLLMATETLWYLNGNSRVFKTTDGGTSWSACAYNRATNVPTGGRFYSLAVDPRNSSVLYSGDNTMIYKSTDGGDSWTPFSTTVSYGPTYAIAIDPRNSNNVFFACMGTLRHSTDGGATIKTYQGNGLPVSVTGSYWAISPANPDRMIVVGGQTLYFTTDGGASWTVKQFGQSFARIHFHPTDELEAYASGSGVLHTTDGGQTWTALPNTYSVDDVMYDPSEPATVWSADAGYHGVKVTTDGGATWKKVATTGMGVSSPHILARTPIAKKVIAGAYGGLFWFDPTPVGVRESVRPATIALAQNVPNPAHAATTITFVLEQRAAVDLRVFDALGREVAVPLNAMLDAGPQVAQFDAAQLPAGSYTYVLRVNGTVESRQMIVAK